MTDQTETTPQKRAPTASEDGQATFRAKIGGMSCSFCTSTIRKAYERMDGVHDVGVSLAHEEGLVRYDPDKLDEGELRRTLEVALADDFDSYTGKGIEASVGGARVLVGKPGFLTERGITIADRERFADLEGQGLTVVGVAVDGEVLGLVGIGDEVKDDAAETIRRMTEAGITPVMITGDNRRTAEAVAAEVGIERVLAEVLPADKAVEVRRLQEGGQRVMMVGDGINDAPALTQAVVGVAIGAGTDIAIESADIVVMTERLAAVMEARDIGMRSYAKTRQNLALAFAFNGIGVPAAATGFVHPIWAMAAMVASVTAVLANSFGGRLLQRARGEQPAEPTGLVEQQHRSEHADEAPSAEQHAAPADGPAHAPQGGQEPRTVSLRVPMHCGNCSEWIETRLAALPGCSGWPPTTKPTS